MAEFPWAKQCISSLSKFTQRAKRTSQPVRHVQTHVLPCAFTTSPHAYFFFEDLHVFAQWCVILSPHLLYLGITELAREFALMQNYICRDAFSTCTYNVFITCVQFSNEISQDIWYGQLNATGGCQWLGIRLHRSDIVWLACLHPLHPAYLCHLNLTLHQPKWNCLTYTRVKQFQNYDKLQVK